MPLKEVNVQDIAEKLAALMPEWPTLVEVHENSLREAECCDRCAFINQKRDACLFSPSDTLDMNVVCDLFMVREED